MVECLADRNAVVRGVEDVLGRADPGAGGAGAGARVRLTAG
ncbi:hypothetical protein FRUB_02135 [Fimbriiglobus ruber]|uniref:Uncharacterized protein n=1 Tax=Fimbriiglobus ruber TaxID=1908690 RepID=A0A225E1Z9_9BACT|nr:hypothetical protein FRUB_02135 [Fimbriiglobus ruber]